MPDQLLPDQLLPDQEFPLQLLPDQKFLDQLLPDQEFPLQLLPDQEFPDQLLPDQEFPDQLLPDQEFPFQTPPDHELPAASSKAIWAASNDPPKMSCSPEERDAVLLGGERRRAKARAVLCRSNRREAARSSRVAASGYLLRSSSPAPWSAGRTLGQRICAGLQEPLHLVRRRLGMLVEEEGGCP